MKLFSDKTIQDDGHIIAKLKLSKFLLNDKTSNKIFRNNKNNLSTKNVVFVYKLANIFNLLSLKQSNV